MIQRYRTLPYLLVLVIISACDSGTAPQTVFNPSIDQDTCELDQAFLLSLLDFDAIPSIDDPMWTEAGSDFTAYLAPDDRVVGLTIQGQAYAVPHNILWHHEIVNMRTELGHFAITYCPLTGSSIAFSRSDVANREFGVSGFLYKNNLVMFDRTDSHSLWVQMEGDASCGPEAGSGLTQWPVVEMRWDRWQELHPSTLVMSQNQGLPITRDYTRDGYPYGDYESYDYDEFLYPARMPELDRRRPVKERVLGIPGGGTTVGPAGNAAPKAFPFDALLALKGSLQVVDFDHDGDAVLLWDDVAVGGMAFRPRTASGEAVDLAVTEEGITDLLTGSVFTVDGKARSGSLQGQSLRTIDSAYVAFWGAWAAFHDGTEIWEGAALEGAAS